MSSKGKKPATKPQRSAIADVVAREYTIHMHKRVRQHHSSPSDSPEFQDAWRGELRYSGRLRADCFI